MIDNFWSEMFMLVYICRLKALCQSFLMAYGSMGLDPAKGVTHGLAAT